MSKPTKLQKSHRNVIILGIALLLIWAAAEAGMKYLQSKPVPAEANLNIILNKASTSYKNWQDLYGQAEIVWKRSDETQSYLVSFDFDLPDSASVNTEDLNGGDNGGKWAFRRDGTITLTDGNQNESQEAIPPSLKQYLDNGQVFEPKSADSVHPFAMAIPSPVGEILFPSWNSQKLNPQNTSLLGEENISNRKVWVLEANLEAGESCKLWVDQETGILLRAYHQISEDFSMELLITRISQFEQYNANAQSLLKGTGE